MDHNEEPWPIPCLACLPVHLLLTGIGWSLSKGRAAGSQDQVVVPAFVLLISLPQLVFPSHPSLLHVFWLLQQLMGNDKGLQTCQ